MTNPKIIPQKFLFENPLLQMDVEKLYLMESL